MLIHHFSFSSRRMERGTPVWNPPHDYGVSRILFSSEELLHHWSNATYPLASSEQPSSTSLHGLAARKVYLSQWITPLLVVSYSTFSALPVPSNLRGKAIGGLNLFSTFCPITFDSPPFRGVRYSELSGLSSPLAWGDKGNRDTNLTIMRELSVNLHPWN